MSASQSAIEIAEPLPARRAARLGPAAWIGVALLAGYALVAIFAPLIAGDYETIRTAQRLRPPGAVHWFGTDHLGREILARCLIGTRTSLLVGLAVTLIAATGGAILGLYSGYFRLADRIIMRVMDGLMAIPGILLAIALASVLGGGFGTLVLAIAIPEVPRMARLTRSIVLSLKEQAFITAAVSIGTPTWKVLFRHILPNSVGALAVQATYVCAAAIITESVLSFLGVGTPADVPSWGNMMSVGRQYFQLASWIIGFPGLFLSVLVLSINLLGDSLRDRLDPRLTRRAGL